MTFEELILVATKLFSEQDISYALVGGVAASFYREEKRTTEDVNFAVALSDDLSKKGFQIVENLGFEARVLTRSELVGGPRFALRSRNRSPEAVIIGRDKTHKIGLGFDILLPSIPWVKDAVERAQDNSIEICGKKIPVITPEDLLIAKLFAINSRSDRDSDISDLKSILRAQKNLDNIYIASKISEHRLSIPKGIEELFDFRVLRAARKFKRIRACIVARTQSRS